ncbi:MAG: FtsX-like permease family protein, partial [Gemmatimonadaceae bacterium]
IPAGVIPRSGGFGLDVTAIAFAFALSLGSAVLFGLWPAIRASLPSLGKALRDGGRGSTGDVRALRTRRLLVIAELSLTVVLAVCATLVAQSLARMMRVDPGFRPEHAITAQITLGPGYPDSTGIAFYRALLTDLAGRPGIIAVGATDTPPLVGGGVFTSIRLVGQPARPPNDPLMSTIRFVTPGFFRAMGMHMLGGHDVAWDEAAPTMVLSRAAARAFWPNASVIDQQIAFNTQPTGLQIVGEVNDAAQTSLATPAAPVVYVSMRRSIRLLRTMTLVVRGRGDAASLAPIVREAVHDVDPALPVYNVQTLQSIVDQSVAQPRLNGALMAVFAAAALLLAALGLYGVVSYSVTQRRQEIGLRVALGAQPGSVLRLVLREGAMLAAVGIAIGAVGALFAARLIRSWLFGIEPADPASFAGVAVVLAAVALAASYLPARRAARVSPLIAMRGD